jgi:hypothetical protein
VEQGFVIGVLAEDESKNVVDTNGNVVQRIRGTKLNFSVSVTWTRAQWAVTNLELL